MNWTDKPLLDKITDRWAEMDDKYNKANRNREMIVNYYRCDEVIEVDDQGQFVGQDIYNASGMFYSQQMARGFQGTFVPKNIPWLAYILDMYELQGIDPLDEWLQEVTKFMADDYRRSNFYDVQPQFILDSLTIGSPVMFGEEDILNRRVVWTPQHYKTVRTYYDRYNEAEGVIVKDTQWTAKKLWDTFVQRDDISGTRRKSILPVPVNQALDSGRLNDTFTVFRAVFKVNDPIWDGWKNKPKGAWKWLGVYFCELAEREQKDTPLNINMGYFSQPFVVNDYDKKPWECVSRTPAWYSIWDNLGLQDMDKGFKENMQLKNRPPRGALSTMKGRLDFSSEGITYMEKDEYQYAPKQIDVIGDINLNEKIIQLNEDKMRRWFMADFWQRFNNLVQTNKAPVSTLQIWQMIAENSTQLSPAIESYSKYLNVSDARHVNIASRRGEYPFDPQTMDEVFSLIVENSRRPVNRIGLTPVFVNALVQAQKRNQELEPLVAGPKLLVESGLTAFDPGARHIVRTYKTADDILKAIGFPQANVRPEDEYNERVAAENKMLAEQQQFENTVEMMKAAKPASDAANMMMGGGA
jgi:hypothetical protein